MASSSSSSSSSSSPSSSSIFLPETVPIFKKLLPLFISLSFSMVCRFRRRFSHIRGWYDAPSGSDKEDREWRRTKWQYTWSQQIFWQMASGCCALRDSRKHLWVWMLVWLTLFPRIIPENYLISLTKKIINQSCSEKEGYLYINENANNSLFVHWFQ